MYQALRSLGIDTQLIIYPNENHGISRPSYVRDRYERYLAWYDKYVRKLPVQPKPMIAGWEGKWKGTLKNIPAKPDAPVVEVTMEIGAFPMTDNTCTMWKLTFASQVRNHKLCRGTGADDLYIDAGDEIKRTVTLLGDTLFLASKNNNVTVMTTNRLRGDILEIETLMADDKPAAMGVVPMNAKGIQRIELKRVIE